MPEQMRMHRLCNSCGGAILLDNLLNATGGKGGRARCLKQIPIFWIGSQMAL